MDEEKVKVVVGSIRAMVEGTENRDLGNCAEQVLAANERALRAWFAEESQETANKVISLLASQDGIALFDRVFAKMAETVVLPENPEIGARFFCLPVVGTFDGVEILSPECFAKIAAGLTQMGVFGDEKEVLTLLPLFPSLQELEQTSWSERLELNTSALADSLSLPGARRLESSKWHDPEFWQADRRNGFCCRFIIGARHRPGSANLPELMNGSSQSAQIAKLIERALESSQGVTCSVSSTWPMELRQGIIHGYILYNEFRLQAFRKRLDNVRLKALLAPVENYKFVVQFLNEDETLAGAFDWYFYGFSSKQEDALQIQHLMSALNGIEIINSAFNAGGVVH